MKRRYMFSLMGMVTLGVVFMGYQWGSRDADGGLSVKIRTQPADARRVTLVSDDQDALRYAIVWADGHSSRLSPDEYARLLYDGRRANGWLFAFLNITSPIGIAWVGLGLLGQVFFTGRMILQWLVSEKEKRSIVPTAFWWMSIAGASMLITYFLWRKDAVGVLGQATGWLIYARNLWLIYLHENNAPPLSGE